MFCFVSVIRDCLHIIWLTDHLFNRRGYYRLFHQNFSVSNITWCTCYSDLNSPGFNGSVWGLQWCPMASVEICSKFPMKWFFEGQTFKYIQSFLWNDILRGKLLVEKDRGYFFHSVFSLVSKLINCIGFLREKKKN